MRVKISDYDSAVRLITIDRPPVNALDNETMEAIGEAVDAAMQATEIRVIVITGEGPKAFAAGADLEELAACDAVAGRKMVTRVKAIMAKFRQGPKPVIAAINGLAAGGGLELAMSCDIRIADARAGLGLPEVTLGVLPGAGGTQMLPRLIGMGKALHLMFSGSIISAEEGLSMGLVDRISKQGEAVKEALSLAARIARNAPMALTEIKAAAYAVFSQPLDRGLSIESEGFARLCDTEDKSEGIAAFKNRRSPAYAGR